MTFILMAAGLLIGLVLHIRAQRWSVSVSLVLMVAAAMLCQVLSASGSFVGPVGDAQSYAATVNGCSFAFRLCGDRVHTYIFGAIATFTGPAWAMVYGFALFRLLVALKSRSKGLLKKPVLLLLLCYSAYQIGNGMGEFTYSVLAVIVAYLFTTHGASAAKRLGNTVLGGAALLLVVIAHPGNVFAAGALLKNWRIALLAALASFILLEVYWADFVALSSKASAIESSETRTAALENKLSASERKAETSYAPQLFDMGFPYEARGAVAAIAFFAAPILAGPSGGTEWLVASLSTLMSAYCLALIFQSRAQYLAMTVAAVVICFFVYGMSSFTAGIGLRHKVPLFIMLFWMATEKTPRIAPAAFAKTRTA
jgi:hypothetical protein